MIAKLIEFKDYAGIPVVINPFHVQHANPNPEFAHLTDLRLRGGSKITVQGSLAKVLKKLRGSDSADR